MLRERLTGWWARQARWSRGFAKALMMVYVGLVVLRVHPVDALWGSAMLSVGHGVAIWITDKLRIRLRP